MPPMVRLALLLMLAALTFYSIGVWSERFAGFLRLRHTVMFWIGFVCDTSGTEVMRRMAGGFEWSFHMATGITALLLMLAHAAWATVVLARRDERSIRTFHRISVVVWAIWLVPFVTGLYVSGKAHL
jgi:uncharacterized repeat protein (TIGR03987 family)